MQQLTESYIEASSQALSDNELLASQNIGIKEMFSKEQLTSHRERLRGHFQELSLFDREYATHLVAHGSINDLLMRNAAIQIMTQGRNMLVGAVKNYESSVTEFEGQLKFRVNITVALVAIVISIIGLAS